MKNRPSWGNIYFLQIKIHIAFVYNILFNADVAEGDGRVGMVKDFLQKFDVIELFVVVVAEGFTQ